MWYLHQCWALHNNFDLITLLKINKHKTFVIYDLVINGTIVICKWNYLVQNTIKTISITSINRSDTETAIESMPWDSATVEKKRSLIYQKTRSTTAAEPLHLKAKEYYISLTKNYCITINIQLNSEIHS